GAGLQGDRRRARRPGRYGGIEDLPHETEAEAPAGSAAERAMRDGRVMEYDDDNQRLVASVLASRPAADVSPGVLARVNARIDAASDEGWFGLAAFRVWTLRIVPAAAALVLIALLWPGTSPTSSRAADSTPTVATSDPAVPQRFTPSSASDWQRDVTANALLEAAMHSRRARRGRLPRDGLGIAG